MTAQDHELTWGAITLSEPSDAPADANYEIHAHTESESNFGNATAVIELVRALLTEGSVAVKTGTEARTITLQLAIVGDDGEALAEGESVLMAEVLAEDPAALRWVPPAAESAPCNFDVLAADLQRGYPDLWLTVLEPRRLTRFFTLTLYCRPYVRTDDPTVVEALPVPSDPGGVALWTDVDTCTSTTGWSRETNAASPLGPTLSGGTRIYVYGQIDHPSDYLRLVRAGSITVPTDQYLAIDVYLQGFQQTGEWRAYWDGVWHSPVAIAPGAGSEGSTRLYFAVTGTSTTLKVAFDWSSVSSTAYAWLYVYNVAYTDTIGSSTTSTNRQQSRLAAVLGSAPTTAALRLFTDDTDLGSTVLLYTAAEESTFPPPLRTWVDSSSAPSTESARISGSYNTLATDMVFLIPASLLSAATYSLVAQLRRNSGSVTTTIEWQARIVDDAGADVLGSDTVASGSTDISLSGTDYHPFALASMTLPPVALDNGEGFAVEITLHMDSDGADVRVDEAWLMDTDRGAYTLLDLPTTAGLSWVEVRSPELDAPLPGVFGGTGGSLFEAGQDISRYAKSFGIHRFLPGTMLVFTADSGTLESQSEIEFYPRFHSHVVYGAAEE